MADNLLLTFEHLGDTTYAYNANFLSPIRNVRGTISSGFPALGEYVFTDTDGRITTGGGLISDSLDVSIDTSRTGIDEDFTEFQSGFTETSFFAWTASTQTTEVTSTTANTPIATNSAATDSEFVVSSSGNFYYEYNSYLQNTTQSVRPELEIYVNGVRQVNYTGSSAPTLTGNQGEIRLASGRLNITNPDSTVRVVTDLKTVTTSAILPEIDGGGFSTFAQSGIHDLPLGNVANPLVKVSLFGVIIFIDLRNYTLILMEISVFLTHHLLILKNGSL